MSKITEQDRSDYEQGREDRHQGVFSTVFNDVTANHPDSDSYYKGRDGEKLDSDKK